MLAKKDLLFVGIWIILSSVAPAQSAEFTKMSDGWTVAPDGTRWSARLGKMSNSGEDGNGTVVDSAATRACHAIAGELPTKADYENLKSYFERDSGGFLTENGRAELLEVFPDMKDENGYFTWFWSSTHTSVNPYFAYLFVSRSGVLINDARIYRFSVRCIQRPKR